MAILRKRFFRKNKEEVSAAHWAICNNREVATMVKNAFPGLYVSSIMPGTMVKARTEEAVFIEGPSR